MKDIEQLVRENMNLVPYVFNEFFRTQVGDREIEEELLSVGRIGLWKAAQGYNAEEGKFSSLAVTCIRNAMQQRLNHMNRKIRKLPRGSFSLSKRTEDGLEIAEFFAASEDHIGEAERQLTIRRWMDRASLTERERLVLRLYLGLDGGKGLSQAAIGRELGVSRQAVRHTYQSAMEKLRSQVKRSEVLALIS